MPHFKHACKSLLSIHSLPLHCRVAQHVLTALHPPSCNHDLSIEASAAAAAAVPRRFKGMLRPPPLPPACYEVVSSEEFHLPLLVAALNVTLFAADEVRGAPAAVAAWRQPARSVRCVTRNGRRSGQGHTPARRSCCCLLALQGCERHHPWAAEALGRTAHAPTLWQALECVTPAVAWDCFHHSTIIAAYKITRQPCNKCAAQQPPHLHTQACGHICL